MSESNVFSLSAGKKRILTKLYLTAITSLLALGIIGFLGLMAAAIHDNFAYAQAVSNSEQSSLGSVVVGSDGGTWIVPSDRVFEALQNGFRRATIEETTNARIDASYAETSWIYGSSEARSLFINVAMATLFFAPALLLIFLKRWLIWLLT